MCCINCKNILHETYFGNEIRKPYYSLFLNYIQACLKQKKYDEALVHCKQFLEKNPTDTTILLIIGNIYSEIGADEMALKYYENAIELSHKSIYNPQNKDA